MKTTLLMLALGVALSASSNVSAQTTASPAANTPVPMPTIETVPATPALCTPQPAETMTQTDGPWALAAIYGWTPGIRGQIGVGRRVVNVDRSVSDVAEKLFKDTEGVATLHTEAGYGDVGVIFDVMYLNLGSGNRIFEADSRSTFAEAIGFYRAVNSGGVTFDVLAGTRYYRFKNDVQIVGLNATGRSRTSDWFDLVVGVRGSVQLCDSLSVFGRVDFGGFGIGNSSDLACNAIVGCEYRCTDCISLYAGYRWFKIDRDEGSGRDRHLIDITLSGPFVAMGLRY